MDELKTPVECEVRLRHSKTAVPCAICLNADGGVDIELHTPGRAPTPGQLAVFYNGDKVLGSAWIEGTK